MYTQNSESSIDPALRALLKVAKQVTPSGQPTVAAQVAQAAQQPAPQGIMSALEQSQQAAPSVEQNMQQQQMAQMAQPAPQMQPQMPPPMEAQMAPPTAQPMEPQGGIASLPVPIGEYAEGGVVGYSGQEGSWVGEEEATSEAGDFLRKLLGGAIESLGDIPKTLRKKALAAKIGSGIVAMKPDVLESLTPRQRESRLTQASQMEAMLAALRGQPTTKEMPQPEAGVTEASVPRIQLTPGGDPKVLIRQLAAELQASDTSPAAKAALTQKIAELTAQLPPPERQLDRVRSEDVGILTPRPEPAMPSIEKPTAASAMEMARLLVPNVDRSESRRLYEERKAQQAASPDFEAQRAAAMEQAYAQETGGRDMERAIRLLTAAAQKGTPGIGVEGLRYRKEKDAIDAAYKQGQIALKEAAQAKAEGNLTKLMEANAKLEDAEAKQAELISRAGIQALSSQSSQYTTNVGAASEAARIASAERMAKLGGVEQAMFRLFESDPEKFASFMSMKSGARPGGTRAAQLDKYRDDYNTLVKDMYGKQSLEDEGIKTFADYIRVNDAYLAGKNPNAPAPQAALDYMKKYGVPQ